MSHGRPAISAGPASAAFHRKARGSRAMQRHPRGGDPLTKKRMADRAFHGEVHPPSEQGLQRLTQAQKILQCGRVMLRIE